MIFRLLNTRNQRPRKSLLVIAFVLALILLCMWQYELVSGMFFGVVSKVARPFFGGKQTAAYVVGSSLKTKHQLELENAALLIRVQNLEGEHMRLAQLMQENRELKDLLGRKNPKEDLVLAAVLAKPPQSPYDTMIIDGGTELGFASGDMIVASGYVAIGTITDVSAKTAKVKLFSSPGEKIIVTLGEKAISVDAIGQGAGNFLAEVPRDAALGEGDLVIFPALDAKVVGAIAKVVMRPSDSFQSVFFRLPVNISELRWVAVIKK